jgi:hypothetical protein
MKGTRRVVLGHFVAGMEELASTADTSRGQIVDLRQAAAGHPAVDRVTSAT